MITIRRSVEADFPAIIETLKEFAIFQKTPPEKVTNTAALMKEEQQYVTCFVAVDEDGEIAGLASCFFAYYTWTGKSLYLDDLYVKEKFRQQGIGKRLLDKIFEFAKAENCKKIHWMVSNWNTNAIDFYIKCGASLYKEEFVCYVEEDGIANYINKIGG